MAERLDTPLPTRRRWLRRPRVDSDAVGSTAEAIARFTGTPRFLVYLSGFVIVWLAWNTWGPEPLRFDSAALGFTAKYRSTLATKQREKIERMRKEAAQGAGQRPISAEDIFGMGGDKKDEKSEENGEGKNGKNDGGSGDDVFEGF